MLVVVIVTILVVALVCAVLTAVCFAVALYELLNGEARTLRLDATLLLPAIVRVATEAAALTACVVLMPLGALARRERAPAGSDRPLVALVATWPLNAASLTILRGRLRRDGWRDVITVASPRRGDLAAAARALAAAIEAAAPAASGRSVMLVGHGTGGVVCRAYLRRHGGLGRVTKLVTLASPHQGSKLYALAPGGLLVDLRADADALVELAADDPVPARVECTAIYSSFDLTVVPSRLAYWPGAGNIEVEGAGHFTMPASRRVYELLRENLEWVAPRAAPPAAGTDAQPAA